MSDKSHSPLSNKSRSMSPRNRSQRKKSDSRSKGKREKSPRSKSHSKSRDKSPRYQRKSFRDNLPKSRKLFVTNIDSSISQEQLKADLEKLFKGYGDVKEITIKTKSGSNNSFVFIEFAEEEEAAKALQNLRGKEFKGKQLKVEFAKGQKRHYDESAYCKFCRKSGHDTRDCRSKRYYRSSRSNSRDRDRNRRGDYQRSRYKDRYRERDDENHRGRSKERQHRKDRSKDRQQKRRDRDRDQHKRRRSPSRSEDSYRKRKRSKSQDLHPKRRDQRSSPGRKGPEYRSKNR